MARFEVTGPDGTRYQVEGPDGTTEQDAIAQAQKQIAAQPAPPSGPDLAATADVPGQQQGTDADVRARVDASGKAWQAAPPIVVGGKEPGYVQSDILPLARRQDVIDNPNSKWHEGWAIAPGPLRALGQTPAENVTINPETGTLGLAPEALTTALTLGGVGGLRFSGGQNNLYVPPGTMNRKAPLSPEFTQNPLGPTMAAREMPTPAGPASPTGVPLKQPAIEMRAVPEQQPQAQPPPASIPPGSGPQPGMGPRPAGAQATPAAQAVLSPEQAAEYGSVADKQWLYKSFTPGEAIPDEFIPGITPTMTQREQTVRAARETKDVRNLSAEAAQAERELLDEHSAKRKSFYQETAGSDVTQGIAIRDADQAINNELAAAFRHGGQVEPQSIIEAIQTERAAPSGKLPGVKAVMKTLEDALKKEDGTPETDPRQVYGVRRVVNYLQSKRALAENPGYGDRDVQAALIRVKAAIDDAIEPVAPGFGKALENYSTAQRAIEAREALQAAEDKLYDQFGHIQFTRIHNLMRDVIKSRDPNAPLNPWQSLTTEQMNRLKALHDDVMRVASAEELAKARGSDTAQNIIGAVKQAAQGLPGTLAAAGAGAVFGGPAGAFLGPLAKEGFGAIFTRGAERRATRRMDELLRPDPTKYPTVPRNPLGP